MDFELATLWILVKYDLNTDAMTEILRWLLKVHQVTETVD